jgi:5-methylthioadenosine/S-adenosylhomocysteine deaminase
VVTLAEQLQLPIHIHVHETRSEIEQSLKEHGVRPLQRLHRLGALGPNLIAVHAVHLLSEEIELLARQGCHVAHCPSSNLKLASGFAPVGALRAHGVNVALGTDGAASNNRLDMFEEMRLSALLAKGVSEDARTFPAHEALEAATLGGATALGLDSLIGSLEPGKSSDLVAVSLDNIESTPSFDVASHLVYAAGREQVTHAWVGGTLVLEDRRLTQMDEHDARARAIQWQAKLKENA